MRREGWSRSCQSTDGGVHWVDVESAWVQHHLSRQQYVLMHVPMVHEHRRQARIGWRQVLQRYKRELVARQRSVHQDSVDAFVLPRTERVEAKTLPCLDLHPRYLRVCGVSDPCRI